VEEALDGGSMESYDKCLKHEESGSNLDPFWKKVQERFRVEAGWSGKKRVYFSFEYRL